MDRMSGPALERLSAMQVKALVFDVFGTVVDWRGSVISEGEAVGRAKGLDVDWARFADEWRKDGYHGGMDSIREGQLPWMNVDALHRLKLEQLLPKYGISGFSESEIDHLNRVWHRLKPWPDAVPGLTRLRRKFIIAPLSNGNFALLTNMAKHAELPWDCILSAELARKYKPDPEAYHMAATLLGLDYGEVMLVAAHVSDLRGAQSAGLRACFVPRPLEHGPAAAREPEPDASFDLLAADFVDLATKLGS
jgi:2-haloacid dehalogenase